MLRSILACVGTFLLAHAAWGITYTVTTDANGGPGSLRWAINQANSHPGKDWVLFHPSLSGAVIEPTTSLPAITDPETIINGDINNDAAPEIALSGANAGTASGLTITADDCTVAGLAVTRFAKHGIVVSGATGCVIHRCHVGVNLAGMMAARNGWDQIHLRSSNNTMIGGTGIGGRNIIAAGSATPLRSGIHLLYGTGNRIRNNNIGIARDGKTSLTDPHGSGVGITLNGMPRIVVGGSGGEIPAAVSPTRFNMIGGTAAECNVFGGMQVGLDLRNAYRNHIRGNYFGLARNGTTRVAIADCCIRVRNGSKNNWIMGLHDTPETRNVISGSTIGVFFKDAGTQDNYLMRNYFGTNAGGTAQRLLGTAVVCHQDAGPQSITHNTILAGHTPKWGAGGISLSNAGAGSYVARNQFGIYTRASARRVKPMDVGVNLEGVNADLLLNDFRTAKTGIRCTGTPPPCLIIRNKFRNCEIAVHLTWFSEPNLGDLGNRTTEDDGGNRFYASNTWFIRNENPKLIKAEGNHFPWLWPPAVRTRIWDKQDNPSYGTVDIWPLGDAVSASATEGMLVLSGTAAIPTAVGAEIAFTLSAPGDVAVAVLNIAGRPVRTICEAKDCEAGINNLLWNGLGSNGLPVPNGRYLIRITARDDRGQSATGLTALRLDR